MLYKDKESLLAKVGEMEDGSFHLLKKEEYDNLLKNFKETEIITEVDRQIGEKVSEIHSQYDQDLKELFGEEKAKDEKTYHFMKRKFKELKEKADGQHDESEELKKFRKEASNKISERDSEIEKLKKSITRERYKGELSSAMAGFEFNDAIPENLRKLAIDSKIEELIENAREDNGAIVWKVNGVDVHDEAYKPLSTKDVIEKVFSDIKKPEGAPVGGGGTPPKKTPSKISAEEAVKILNKEGLRAGTQSFQDKFKELTGIGSNEE